MTQLLRAFAITDTARFGRPMSRRSGNSRRIAVAGDIGDVGPDQIRDDVPAIIGAHHVDRAGAARRILEGRRVDIGINRRRKLGIVVGMAAKVANF
jgi:hypothetical protein